MQPFINFRRLISIERIIKMTLKIKTMEKLTATMVILNITVLAVMCYFYYLKI